MMRRSIFVLVILAIFLAACSPAGKYTPAAATEQPVKTESPAPTETRAAVPTASNTPPPPTATFTAEPSATSEPLKILFVSASAKYQISSQFALDFDRAVGEYYAKGYASTGGSDYICAFNETLPNRLVCKGGFVPFNTSIYVQLFRSDTNEEVYSNMIRFAGVIPTPTGLVCEIEPQWNGFEPAHQRDAGCFAITCYQNGEFFYGDNYTCDTVWPFDWDFTHPLYTPQP